VLQVVWDITDEELKRLDSINSAIDEFRHVCYDVDTGIIKSISTSQVENMPFVLVHFDQVKDILEGKDFVENYKIIFSSDDKDFVFVKKEDEEEILQSINDVIFQIPFLVNTGYPIIYDSLNDITIIQDYNDTCWKVYINGGLAYRLKKKNLYFDKSFDFYITDYNDPNILHKTISVPVKDLLVNFCVIFPFDELEYQEQRVSIFTRKLFTKYQHIKTKL
jgi:hypothetical protein